jgi:hypothetical protein
MSSTTDSSITLTISDISASGSIAAAIIAACKESDYLSSGIVGPSFSTSGPGSGWSKQHTADDYASRALSDDHGAAGYVADDGRLATLDADGEVEWSDESVVTLESPTVADVDESLDAVRQMVAAIDSGHCTAEHPSDWDDIRAWVEVSRADALERIDGEIIGDKILYYDDCMQRWYVGETSDLTLLREYMGSGDEEVARDAYSHWCAACGHDGEYETRDAAIESIS